MRTVAYIKMNNHFQGVNSAKRPAKRAPTQPPIGAPALKRPRLKFRFLPGGNVVPMTATAFGTIMAPPTPDKPLIRLNAIKLLQKALTKVHRTHHPAPASRIFLWPYIYPLVSPRTLAYLLPVRRLKGQNRTLHIKHQHTGGMIAMNKYMSQTMLITATCSTLTALLLKTLPSHRYGLIGSGANGHWIIVTSSISCSTI